MTPAKPVRNQPRKVTGTAISLGTIILLSVLLFCCYYPVCPTYGPALKGGTVAAESGQTMEKLLPPVWVAEPRVIPISERFKKLFTEFGIYDGYAEWHLKRLAFTLSQVEPFVYLVEGDEPNIVLHGEKEHIPLVFKKIFGVDKFTTTSKDPDSVGNVVLQSNDSGEKVSFEVKSMDVVRERWPFPDNSVDIIVAFELLEHFLYDPMWFVLEAHRVLKPETGVLFMSTPNINSFESIRDAVLGRTPQMFVRYMGNVGSTTHIKEYSWDEIDHMFEGGWTLDHFSFSPYPVQYSEQDTQLFHSLVKNGYNTYIAGRGHFVRAVKKADEKPKFRFPPGYSLYYFEADEAPESIPFEDYPSNSDPSQWFTYY